MAVSGYSSFSLGDGVITNNYNPSSRSYDDNLGNYIDSSVKIQSVTLIPHQGDPYTDTWWTLHNGDIFSAAEKIEKEGLGDATKLLGDAMFGSSFGGSLGKEAVSLLVFDVAKGVVPKTITNIVKGDFDQIWPTIKKETAKTWAKALPKMVLNIGTMVLTYAWAKKGVAAGKFLTYDKASKLAKNSVVKYWDAVITDGIEGKLRVEVDEVKTAYERLTAAKAADGIKSTKVTRRELKAATRAYHQEMDPLYVRRALGQDPGTSWKNTTISSRISAGGSFLKNYGASMAAGIAVDTVISVAGNVAKNLLIDKMSLGDAIKNSDMGAEFLKASVKGVCTTAGAIIGGCFGNAELGKKIGSLAGGIIGDWAVKPFTLPDGTIEQGWCAVAGCAVIGGAVLGGIIAAALICGCSGPVGWIVGAAMLVGAFVGYLIVWACHGF